MWPLVRRQGDDAPQGMIAFESLQGLKGSVYFYGEYDKLRWMSELEFDLLIVDEAQEGVDTMRTERAFRKIQRRHTLYLSGTPFKALASEPVLQRADLQLVLFRRAGGQRKLGWGGRKSL